MEHEMEIYAFDGRKDKKQQKKAIKKNAIRFTKIVNLVGLRHATDSRNSHLRRIFWVSWLVFGVGLAVFQIQDRFFYYFDYPSTTQLRITADEKLLFPQVTICWDNQIMASKARDQGVFKDIAYIENTMQRIRVYEERPYLTNATRILKIARDQLQEFIQKVHNATTNWQNMSKTLAISVTEAVKLASFDNEKYNKTKLEDIEEVVTDLGQCFAFSTKKNSLKVSKPGPLYGLTVVLYSPSLEVIPSVRYLANKESLPGFRVLIHDRDEIPRMRDAGFTVKPGKTTRVTIEFENEIQLEHPYGKCKPEDMDYRYTTCIAKHESKLFVQKCGCRDIYMKDLVDQDKVCSFGEILKCKNNNSDSVEKEPGDIDCPQQCFRRVYKTATTESEMSSVSWAELLGDTSTNDMMQLEIYYPQMSYLQAKSVVAYTSFALLCDIGNALSLLLGATLLTIYEVLEFIFLFVKDYSRFQFIK